MLQLLAGLVGAALCLQLKGMMQYEVAPAHPSTLPFCGCHAFLQTKLSSALRELGFRGCGSS